MLQDNAGGYKNQSIRSVGSCRARGNCLGAQVEGMCGWRL